MSLYTSWLEKVGTAALRKIDEIATHSNRNEFVHSPPALKTSRIMSCFYLRQFPFYGPCDIDKRLPTMHNVHDSSAHHCSCSTPVRPTYRIVKQSRRQLQCDCSPGQTFTSLTPGTKIQHTTRVSYRISTWCIADNPSTKHTGQ